MRTSTRKALLREPAQRWKTGGSANAEWTSELQGEGASRSPRRNRHRYQAGGRSETIRTPQRVRLANQTLHIHAGFCVYHRPNLGGTTSESPSQEWDGLFYFHRAASKPDAGSKKIGRPI
jgi:hypothetical protein